MTECWQEPLSKNSCEAVIESSVRITPKLGHEVHQLRLRVSKPSFHYGVGQGIGVLVPGPVPSAIRTSPALLHRQPLQTGNTESITL